MDAMPRSAAPKPRPRLQHARRGDGLDRPPARPPCPAGIRSPGRMGHHASGEHLALIPGRWLASVDPDRAAEILSAASSAIGDTDVVQARAAFAQYVVANPSASLWTFATYALLHGSWTHVIFNVVWLAAFGSPVARRCGPLALWPPRAHRRGGGRRSPRGDRPVEHGPADRRLGRCLGADGRRRALRVPAAAVLPCQPALAARRPAAAPGPSPNSCAIARR